jgi:hypothetical protein
LQISANVLDDLRLLWQRVQQQGDDPRRPKLFVGQNLKPLVGLVILPSPVEYVQTEACPLSQYISASVAYALAQHVRCGVTDGFQMPLVGQNRWSLLILSKYRKCCGRPYVGISCKRETARSGLSSRAPSAFRRTSLECLHYGLSLAYMARVRFSHLGRPRRRSCLRQSHLRGSANPVFTLDHLCLGEQERDCPSPPIEAFLVDLSPRIMSKRRIFATSVSTSAQAAHDDPFSIGY